MSIIDDGDPHPTILVFALARKVGTTRSVSCIGRMAGALLPVLLLTGLTACSEQKTEVVEEPRPVRVVTVTEREAGETVTLSGAVEAKTEVDLSFRIGGRVLERLVNVGDKVGAGQLVARLDSQDEENALRAARAELTAAEGQYFEAERNHDRQRQLLDRGHTTKQRFDEAVQLLNTLSARVDSAAAQLAIAENRLDDTRLYADAPGEVTARRVEAGEVVQPGQMIVRIARKGGRDAVFDAPANLVAGGRPDAEITVSLSIDPAVVASGRIREVSPQADPVTGSFRVRVGLIDPPAAMRLGSTVTGRMTMEKAGGIAIPATALSRSEGVPAVWVVDTATETVSLRPVGVATHHPSEVVLSDGLSPGEIVVTAGVQTLRPGQRVRLLGKRS